MTDVTVTDLGDLRYGVEIADGESARSSHTVTVPQELLDDLQLTERDATRLVWESFQFLLERERPTQILREFSLDEIERYFPGYRSEILPRVIA
jgi:hypothetical protein